MTVSLKKNHTVHLKPDGEICNRLKLGTKVQIVRRKVIGLILIGVAEKRRAGFISQNRDI